MNKLKLLLVLFYVTFSSEIIAQPYFQQEVNYNMQVRLDDVKHELFADVIIEYKNNSPQTLDVIYMHLWPNAYKDNTTALVKQQVENGDKKLYYAKDEERGFIDLLDFKVNTKPVKWELLKDSIDICKITLNEPLKSGEKLNISTPFHVKIPSGEFSRLGHIGQSYQITQWYPKPAVFDKNGWNYMPYLNQGEFYSEFGSFDVQIIVPKNYVLGATGDLVDGEEELKWLEENVRATEAIERFDASDLAFPKSDSATKTLHFRQSNVHDFAWFCDKRYHVLKGEVVTPHTKNKVTTWVMFTNSEGNLWKNSIKYMNDAIYYYSLWNGDYPYKHCTAVDGTISAGGGMEYPNITVIGASGNAFQLDVVITHEVGHNWFYGMLGSNERIHPWMDEGLNSFNELRYVRTKYPDRKLIGDMANGPVGKVFDLKSYKQHIQYYLTYLISAAKNEDQAIETPAFEYTELNYGGIVYSKTAVVMDYLMAYLGEETMNKAMQEYFNQWHFKHPQPNDFKTVLENVSGKNLDWFFNDLINSTKKLDYKVSKVKHNRDNSYNILVKNTGETKAPVIIHGIRDNKIVGEVTYDGFKGKQSLSFPASEIDYFKIDYNQVSPEINRNNNRIKTKGLFKKTEPIKIQFLGSLDNPDKTQLFWTPVAGWNNYNKWMFGLALYNNLLPQKKFEFELMPMYSYTTNDFAGYGHLAYNILPNNNLFQKISIGVTGARYAYSNNPLYMNFNKIAPEINIDFKKSSARSKIKNNIRYRNISIIKDTYKGNYDVTPAIYSYDTLSYNYNELTYTLSNNHTITPYSISLNYQYGKQLNAVSGFNNGEFSKLSLTANYSYKFKNKNKSFDVRFFAGTFIGTTKANAGAYRFRLSGFRGYQDYLYDNIYLGRTETDGILANQFTEKEGAFKFYSPIGQSSEWIASLNLKSSLGNLKIPINLYADIGTTGTDGILNESILYNAGVCLSIRKNIFEIYFPLLISKDFQDYKKANGIKYEETIRFTLNLNLINPFDLIRKLEL
jgi:hypothetical protein